MSHQAASHLHILPSCCIRLPFSPYERYHALDVNFHARWRSGTKSVWHAEDLESLHGIASKDLLGQISETSVSFHIKDHDGRGKTMFADDGMRYVCTSMSAFSQSFREFWLLFVYMIGLMIAVVTDALHFFS